MSVFDMFDKLDDIIYEPVKAISEWIKEPLRRFEADRDLAAQRQNAEIEQERERERAVLDADIRRWNAEIDDMICMKEIERNKKILDTITEYRRSMIEDMQKVADNLSRMNFELLDTANKLVLARTEDYRKLQEKALEAQTKRLDEIEKRHSNNERLLVRLEDQVINQTDTIINAAGKFINQLSDDIKKITDNNIEIVDRTTNRIEGTLEKMSENLSVSDNNLLIEKKY